MSFDADLHPAGRLFPLPMLMTATCAFLLRDKTPAKIQRHILAKTTQQKP
jgi:hypothetical protein